MRQFTLKPIISASIAVSMGCVGAAAYADGVVPLVDVGVSIDYHVPKISGSLESSGTFVRTISSTEQKPDNQVVLGAYIEHPLPIIPNVALRYTPLKITDAVTNISSNIGGFNVGSASSDVTLNQLDATLYYKVGLPLTDVLKLKAGVRLKSLSGTVDTTQKTLTLFTSHDTTKLSEVLPMAYVGARVKVPATPLAVAADVSFTTFDGQKVGDYSIQGEYEFSSIPGLKAQAGYRYIKLNLDNLDGWSTNGNMRSGYAGLSFAF